MGTTTRYGCSNCGLDSGDLAVGFGFDMIERVPAPCTRCAMVVVFERGDLGEGSSPRRRQADSDRTGTCPTCGSPVAPLENYDAIDDVIDDVRRWPCPRCTSPSLRAIDPDMLMMWD
jgi:endogenous inhibitor of DNA gyrase (YacG/DUF329 family)